MDLSKPGDKFAQEDNERHDQSLVLLSFNSVFEQTYLGRSIDPYQKLQIMASDRVLHYLPFT